MRRLVPWLGILALVSALAAGGCGGDQGERGLAVPDEVATPDSAQDDAETEAQRQQRLADEMQQQEREAFDAANAEEPPAP